MIRTFHSIPDKAVILGCLLPGTVLAVFFFWVRQPLPALCCMIFLVLVVERLIHTEYVFSDEGTLHINKGRFARRVVWDLRDIVRAERVKPSSVSLLRNRDTVILVKADGSSLFITPVPADEFCRYLRKRQDALNQKEE